MSIDTAELFFIDELKDIYSAEKQAIRIYPKLSKSVQSGELKEALQTHLEETKVQIQRLDRVFEILGKRATGKTCEGMKGVLQEAQDAVDEVEKGSLRDAALIASAQRSEHYEIAAYGTVLALAKAMGQSEIATLLGETLEEEKTTDKKLTTISKAVNKQAIAETAAEKKAEITAAEEPGENEAETASVPKAKPQGKTAKR